MKLVIVDDVATNRKLLRATLKAEGHTTRGPADGIEALQILTRERVNAVLPDIVMPRMDGFRLCHKSAGTTGPAICPSSYTAPHTTLQAMRCLALNPGADKYLRRPASVEKILGALHEAIATPHTAPRLESMREVEMLREYSDGLVAKLEERNKELERQHRLATLAMEVGAALPHGDTLREILQCCAEALVQHLDAALARNVIPRVRETGDASEDALRELADRYDYDALTQVLEEACKHKATS